MKKAVVFVRTKKWGFKPLFLSAMLTLMVTGNAFALDWTGVSLDTSDVDSAMALIVVGLVSLWGYRKVIKTLNRS